MIVFCCICKRHVDLGELAASKDAVADAMRRFRASGHDDRKVPRLRRGQVGVYMRDVPDPDELLATVPSAVTECFGNETRIAA